MRAFASGTAVLIPFFSSLSLLSFSPLPLPCVRVCVPEFATNGFNKTEIQPKKNF
jgi:hypothetical protein